MRKLPEAPNDVHLSPPLLLATVAVTIVLCSTGSRLALDTEFVKDPASIAMVGLATLYYILYIKYQIYPLIS